MTRKQTGERSKKKIKRQNKAEKKEKPVTEGNVWKPTPRQMKMVELLNNPDDIRTKEDKCNEVGVTRKTMYEWLKIPEFVVYMNSQLDKYTNGSLPDIWKAHINQCKRGNIEAIKLYHQLKGNLKSESSMKLKTSQPGDDGGTNVIEIEVTLTDED